MIDELIRLSAREAVAKLRAKEITPLELIDAAASRIAAIEPAVNALPTLCLERARDHAKRLMRGDGRAAEGEAGWLAGLPVAIKDLTDVAGVRTTYGSPIFRDHVPTRSHPLVERIERKGGIIIAKSNTPEFGAGGSTFNEVFGRTRNPWNTALTPRDWPADPSRAASAPPMAAASLWSESRRNAIPRSGTRTRPRAAAPPGRSPPRPARRCGCPAGAAPSCTRSPPPTVTSLRRSLSV